MLAHLISRGFKPRSIPLYVSAMAVWIFLSIPAPLAGNSDPAVADYPCLTGICGYVYAVAEYNGDLYAAGEFDMVDGQSGYHNIARWDGSQWNIVGGGTGNGVIRSLCVYDGRLYAGGYFLTVGAVTANDIAVWDGSVWSAVGDGINGSIGVTEMLVYDNKLFIQGGVDTVGTVVVDGLAAWDGSTWSTVGNGSAGSTMAVFDGNLVVIEGDEARFWDGSSWTTYPFDFTFRPKTAIEYDGKLIVGGFFSEVDGIPVNNIAAWDGSSWSAMGDGLEAIGTGLNTYLWSLFVSDGSLYAGGNFNFSGTDSVNFIARWDGITWTGLGSGVGVNEYPGSSATVFAITSYNGDIIAGGGFTLAGGKIANRIAGWDGAAWYPLTASAGIPFGITLPERTLLTFGDTIEIPVTKITGSDEMQGFSFLMGFTNDAITLIDVLPGELFDEQGDYMWEYFTYRTVTFNGCDTTCPSGLVRTVAIAETNNGPYHPTSYSIYNGAILFTLRFVVSSDTTMYACTNFPLYFFWIDCGDNSIALPGETVALAISNEIYTSDLEEISDPYADFPTQFGAPESCIGEIENPAVRYINFYNGKMYFDCPIDPLFEVGDINLNGISFEIADMVMFYNFFLKGTAAFPVDVSHSIANSDIDFNGTPLEIGDFVNLGRVIMGCMLPPQGIGSQVDTVTIIQNPLTGQVSFTGDDSLGGVFVIFDDEIEAGPLIDTNYFDFVTVFDSTYNYTRVILTPKFEAYCEFEGLSPGPLFWYAGPGEIIQSAMIDSIAVAGAQAASLAADYVVTNLLVIQPNPCGDANFDGKVNIGDAVFLINYIFKQGPAPTTAFADANEDGEINLEDVISIVNYIFHGGSLPVCIE